MFGQAFNLRKFIYQLHAQSLTHLIYNFVFIQVLHYNRSYRTFNMEKTSKKIQVTMLTDNKNINLICHNFPAPLGDKAFNCILKSSKPLRFEESGMQMFMV